MIAWGWTRGGRPSHRHPDHLAARKGRRRAWRSNPNSNGRIAMRKLAVTLALVVTLVAATAALAATKIAGTYKTTIKTGSLAGTWQVVIGKGKYTASDNGTVLVMGKYKIKKNVISL